MRGLGRLQEEETKTDYLKKNGWRKNAGRWHSRQKSTLLKVEDAKGRAVFEELHNFLVARQFPHESII